MLHFILFFFREQVFKNLKKKKKRVPIFHTNSGPTKSNVSQGGILKEFETIIFFLQFSKTYGKNNKQMKKTGKRRGKVECFVKTWHELTKKKYKFNILR